MGNGAGSEGASGQLTCSLGFVEQCRAATTALCAMQANGNDGEMRVPIGQPYNRWPSSCRDSCTSSSRDEDQQTLLGGLSSAFSRTPSVDQFSDWFKNQFPAKESTNLGAGFLGREWGSAHAAFGELESPRRPEGRQPLPLSLNDEEGLFCPPSPVGSSKSCSQEHMHPNHAEPWHNPAVGGS
eukprot:gnl/TRDRNA2_/TRDRNA2_187533_c0_seq1.p2 gnl/TRDRNA2_/TRDRNA2_187533_c0~~gnl/TRDRNA2_/TRDRNA2_187533_c0_seq1.p2  ORF type:complete len:206 (+),score=27.78 gnl/TRDRNA2_/TRDRNA2_187533_c0_seq1:71-619(+)